MEKFKLTILKNILERGIKKIDNFTTGKVVKFKLKDVQLPIIVDQEFLIERLGTIWGGVAIDDQVIISHNPNRSDDVSDTANIRMAFVACHEMGHVYENYTSLRRVLYHACKIVIASKSKKAYEYFKKNRLHVSKKSEKFADKFAIEMLGLTKAEYASCIEGLSKEGPHADARAEILAEWKD